MFSVMSNRGGGEPRRPRLAVALAVAALAGFAAPAVAEGPKKPAAQVIQVAEAVPLPRPNPKRAIGDPIGNLLSNASALLSGDDSAAPTTEDADAPEVAAPSEPQSVAPSI